MGKPYSLDLRAQIVGYLRQVIRRVRQAGRLG